MGGPQADQTASGRFGKFILHRRLGTGAMAVVYLAEMVGPNGFSKMVALKRLHPHLADNEEFIDSFISEARLGGSLEHPNIVQTIELGREGDSYYLAMELVQGTTLRKLIRASQKKWVPLPTPAALEVIHQLAVGLDYAHTATNARGQSLSLIHRDLKPGNVLLNQFGQVKITDWGVAKSAASIRATVDGNMLKGTISYMSPEQAACQHIDGRSDLYALGTILFEMLTGERLYPGDIGVQGIYQIIQGNITDRLPLLETYSKELQAFIARILETDRDRRYQSATDLIKDLKPLLKMYQSSQSDLADVVKKVAAIKGGGTSAQLGVPLSGNHPRPNLKGDIRVKGPASIQQDLILDGYIEGSQTSPSGRGELSLDPNKKRLRDPAVSLNSHGSVAGKKPVGRKNPQGSSLRAPRPSPQKQHSVWAPILKFAQNKHTFLFLILPILLLVGVGLGTWLWWLAKPAPVPTVMVRAISTPIPQIVDSAPEIVPDPPVTQTVEPTPEPIKEKKPVKRVVKLVATQPPVVVSQPSISAPKGGFLTVNSRPWAWVSVDGSRLKKPTPLMKEPLSSGTHRLIFETEDGRKHGPIVVDVRAGKIVSLKPVIF